MTEDHGIFDKLIIPDNTVKISITDEILALWLAHGGPNDAGFPKVYVDNNPCDFWYRVKHPNLKEAAMQEMAEDDKAHAMMERNAGL